MLQETYACCVLMKPSNGFDISGVAIKYPLLKGVFVIPHCLVSDQKHMSINKLKPKLKQTKSMKDILRFMKPKSVFAKWDEPQNILDKAFKFDMQNTKIHRFVKCSDDRAAITKVLRKHYYQLKNLFLNLIASPVTYPSIGWLDFSEITK